MKARYELKSLPECFDSCISNVESGLNADEKNCMINCYYKKIGVPEDTMMFFMQKNVANQRKDMLDTVV